MLSDEEKKALKVVNKRTERLIEELKIEEEDLIDEPKIAYLITQIESNKTLVNLIEKQSKEIEELKDKCKKKNKTIETMQFIKAIERGQENTLLITEEQCAIKNKYMMEVSNGEFVDANELYSIWKNSVSKDKIKAKIEELEKLDFGTDLVSQFTANLTTITILQSLLEKE